MPPEQHICIMQDRVNRIEQRTTELEKSTAVMAEHLKNIDANVSSMKDTWTWVGRTIIGSCIIGISTLLFAFVKIGLGK